MGGTGGVASCFHLGDSFIEVRGGLIYMTRKFEMSLGRVRCAYANKHMTRLLHFRLEDGSVMTVTLIFSYL